LFAINPLDFVSYPWSHSLVAQIVWGWRRTFMRVLVLKGRIAPATYSIILVVDMLGQLDRVRARAAAERMFGERNTHPFPPETIIPPEWHVELETLADELGYRTTKAAEIQKNLRI
jgi:hypothetical protein